MAEKHIQAHKDYLKGMKYKDLAERYGVSVNTIKSWKQRHGWQRKKGAPPRKSVHTKKVGAPLGNKNALGNKGGAPQRNQNAMTHGFFSKFLPEETLSIMEEIQECSPVDMIWDQIQIQYAAIIRAQKLMFVSDKEEMIKELKKKKSVLSETNEVEEEEYEFQFSWDRHATFLNAQSRAMAELRNLIKQFDELAHSEDERRLKLEHMRLNINKKKLEIEELTEEDKPFEITIVNKGDDSD
ncbi:phage terminase small subunit [Bacillus inaquosorum]|uniref:phage terminase small subunit n=1 Tax=Bacillus inaquosorum TaxID=483913 RepID=UPI002281A530|nr:phage terminase small subunit [Bacillus inaquosorum]MCY8373340.1 phage terminase small subunit [Bacillus inaquosorum]MEC0559278.1 phage terminase small subunit [Bacillus inaquosorum]